MSWSRTALTDFAWDPGGGSITFGRLIADGEVEHELWRVDVADDWPHDAAPRGLGVSAMGFASQPVAVD
jgi:hypothetical protein